MSGLTIEELITMGYHLNPREFNYKAQFKRLKKIHGFTFDARHKITPARKSAIRKAYNKYNVSLNKIEKGIYTFIPAKKSQIKNLGEQFPHSNKGIIYNHPVAPETKRETKIFGKGKHTKLVDAITIYDPEKEYAPIKKYTFYIPFPDDFSPVYIDSYIDLINDRLNPDYVSVAINGYAGTREYQPQHMTGYGQQLMDNLLIEQDIEDETTKDIFTGVYIVYYRKRLNKKWLEKIKRIINSLF